MPQHIALAKTIDAQATHMAKEATRLRRLAVRVAVGTVTSPRVIADQMRIRSPRTSNYGTTRTRLYER